MIRDLRGSIFERLKHSVQLLAMPAEIQLNLLPSFVCKADELALEFDHWREVSFHNYRNEFSAEQLSAMIELNGKLDWLTANGKHHWTEEAVRMSPEWEDVRHLAAQVLKAFSWTTEIPPSYAHEYIGNPIQRHEEN